MKTFRIVLFVVLGLFLLLFLLKDRIVVHLFYSSQNSDANFIEFILKLDNTILAGIDIIEWENNKMKELRAYLDIPCGDN